MCLMITNLLTAVCCDLQSKAGGDARVAAAVCPLCCVARAAALPILLLSGTILTFTK